MSKATVTKIRTLACDPLHFLQKQKRIIELKSSLILLFLQPTYQSLYIAFKDLYSWPYSYFRYVLAFSDVKLLVGLVFKAVNSDKGRKLLRLIELASLYTLKDKRCSVFFTSFLVIFLYTNLMYTKYSTRKKQKQNKNKCYSHSSTKYSYISAF